MADIITPTAQWSNIDNSEIYNYLPIDDFKNLAEKVGIANGEDIVAISSYLKQAKSILEVGGGYGRVVSKVLEIAPTVEISVVERNLRFVKYLSSKYKNINFIFGTLPFIEINTKFDVVLVMWSTLGEFAKNEQKIVFRKLSNLLNKGGILVLDFCSIEKEHPYAHISGHDVEIPTSYGLDRLYLPSEQELLSYSHQEKAQLESKIIYLTKTKEERSSFIFRYF